MRRDREENAFPGLGRTALLRFRRLENVQGEGDDSGQGLGEYALIIALVAIALIVVLEVMTGAVSGVFESISDALGDAADID